MIDANQVINSQKQTLLNTQSADQLLAGKSFFENVKYAFGVVRKTSYIDHMSRQLKLLIICLAQWNLMILRRFGKEKRALLTKSINDNKIDVMGAIIGAISSYISSVGVLIPIVLVFYEIGVNAFSDFLILGFIGVLFFGLYEGYFSQCGLKRLVKENKDYTCEFGEVDGLLEKKKNLPIR